MAATKSRSSGTKPKESRPVLLNGEPAQNRHFLLDRDLVARASDRCHKRGIALSDVLRHGLRVYGEGKPKTTALRDDGLLPSKTQRELARMWHSGDSDRINHFLSALHQAGWPTQALADSIVASGAVPKLSKQAVSLRINNVSEGVRDDLPQVPTRGPRRTIASHRKGQKGLARKNTKREPTAHDVAFRVSETDYQKARQRATAEQAMISKVLDEALETFLSGKYDKALTKTS